MTSPIDSTAGRIVLPAAPLLPPPYARPQGVHPPLTFPGYLSTVLRAPAQELVPLPHGLTELTGPVLGDLAGHATHTDLTRARGGEAIGQRIIVHGRVLDGDGRAVPDTLIEVWQANAAGRYRHLRDQWPAPLDPHFDGWGRVVTDAEGRYSLTTIRPGAYPWKNHLNAWRPAHIHFSLFGRAFTQRLVTQMYLPGDPLFDQDPIFQSIPDESARRRLIAHHDWSATVPEHALGLRFDIVLRGRDQTYFESEDVDADEA